MPTPLWSNPLLLARAGTLRTVLNSGHTLRLFVNNFLPDPASPLAYFIEATFSGYAPIPLTSLFPAATQVRNGQYELDSGILVFSCTGGSSQTIFGWYIDDGTDMVACQLLDVPVVICAQGVYSVEIRPQEISQSVL